MITDYLNVCIFIPAELIGSTYLNFSGVGTSILTDSFSGTLLVYWTGLALVDVVDPSMGLTDMFIYSILNPKI